MNKFQIKIFDIKGREVKTLVNEVQNPGRKFVCGMVKINLVMMCLSRNVYLHNIKVGNI